MNKNDSSTVRAREALKKALQAQSMNRLARAIKVNRGQISKVLAGKAPASNRLLLALGLPLRVAEAQPCPTCGQVHVVGWCTQLHGEPVMPKPRRPRTSLYIKDWPAPRLRWAFDNREVMA